MIDTANKTYRTNDGRDPVIYTTNSGDESFPIHGAVRSGFSVVLVAWTSNGLANRALDDAESLDLVEVIPERWHPILRHKEGRYIMSAKSFPSREVAMDIERNDAVWTVVDAWKAPV